VALVLSLVISRTLTPMLCAYVLKPESKEHGWLYRLFERGFDVLLNGYEAGLKIVLRHRVITLMVMFATVAMTGYLYVIMPKGFLPPAGHRIDPRLFRGRAGHLLSGHGRTAAGADRCRAGGSSGRLGRHGIGAVGGNYTTNTGRMFISLKPKSERNASADQVILRLQQRLAKIQGIALYMQAAQDITIGGG